MSSSLGDGAEVILFFLKAKILMFTGGSGESSAHDGPSCLKFLEEEVISQALSGVFGVWFHLLRTRDMVNIQEAQMSHTRLVTSTINNLMPFDPK